MHFLFVTLFPKYLNFARRIYEISSVIRGCIQKFSDWHPGARTANGTTLCH